ncbi:transcription antitermination regulator [Streptomyces fumigatiscleroticus]|nr:transcription antitermination regulator [Streptomyces fumigatiscleroticus]
MTDAQSTGPGSGEQLLVRLQTLLLEADRAEEFLQALVTLAATELSVPVSCSVTLESEDAPRPYTAAASHEAVHCVDRRQYETGEGPCLETLRTGTPHHIEDLDREDRFGAFPLLARQCGLRSVLALPLAPPRQEAAGALNLYATAPGSFPGPVRERAAVFAGHASGALGVALKLAGQAQFSRDLERAIASRTVIDQALGILMAQQRCTAEQALAILARASQNRNVKLRDLAAGIVTSVSGRPPSVRPLRPRIPSESGPGEPGFRPVGEG